MEYSSSIEKIKKQKHEIKRILMLEKALTPIQKEELKLTIASLKQIEAILSDKYFTFSLSKRIQYIDMDRLIPLSSYQDYKNIPVDIRRVIIGAINCFKDFNLDMENIISSKLNVSNQDLIDLSYQFYQWLPDSKYLSLYSEYIESKKSNLYFLDYSNTETVIRGLTFPIYFPNYEPHIFIFRDYSIEDLYSLCHEGAHAIFLKEDRPLMNHHFFLQELEGCFFNYLSSQYLKNKCDGRVILSQDYGYLAGQFDNIIAIYIFNLALKILHNEGQISFSKIKEEILKRNLPIITEKNILRETLLEKTKVKAMYILSYLTTLDLEPIFEQDPEYAFYLFEKIRRNKTDDIFSNLRENGITFMDDGYQNLQKKIKTFGEIKL